MAVEHINENQFKSVVLDSQKPVLVDFFATWCGPCRQMSPVLDQIASERNDVKIVKVDVDQSSDLASKYGVMGVPTMIVFKDGQIANKAVGYKNEAGVEAMLG